MGSSTVSNIIIVLFAIACIYELVFLVVVNILFTYQEACSTVMRMNVGC